MKRLGGILLGILALSTQLGCLLWPFPTGRLLSGRGRIRTEDAGPLLAGKASREDVLLRLGEPDEVLDGGKVYIYHWNEERGFFVVAGPGGQGVGVPFPGHRKLRLEFGPDARLLRLAFGPMEAQEADQEGAPKKPDSPH